MQEARARAIASLETEIALAHENNDLEIFFSCIAERARGMVGQLSKCAKAKKGETGIAQESFHRQEGGNNKQTKQKKQTQANKQTTKHKKQPVKILAKVVKPARPQKPLRSSLPPCSMSSMPSKQLIRCPSCPLLCLPALADLSHQVRVFAELVCALLFATALHSNPCMYQSRREHSHPCP